MNKYTRKILDAFLGFFKQSNLEKNTVFFWRKEYGTPSAQPGPNTKAANGGTIRPLDES